MTFNMQTDPGCCLHTMFWNISKAIHLEDQFSSIVWITKQNLHWQNHHPVSWSPLSPCQKKTAHLSRLKFKSQDSVVFLNQYFVITSYASRSKMCSKTCISVNMQLWIILLDCETTFLLVAINIHKAFEPTLQWKPSFV